MPQVSVIIPTYNRKTYVQETIDSVLAQIFTDYEVIVIDDGSTDGTGEALQARYGDRITYIWQENQGESAARNLGIEKAKGEFIAFLDSDDIWLPHKLKKQVAYMENHPLVDLLFGCNRLIDQDGRPIESSAPSNYQAMVPFDKTILYFWNPIGGPSTTLIRKSRLDWVGGFDPTIKFGEDWDLWFRIAEADNVVMLEDVVAYIRRHRKGQAHYPNARHNAQRLADRVKMLKKAFARDGVSEAFQRTVLARQYAQAFIWEQAVGNQEVAQQNLRLAKEHDPSFVYSAEFGQMITAYPSQLVGDSGAHDFHLAIESLGKTLQVWHAICGPDRHFDRMIKSQAYTAFSFIALRAGQSPRTRRYAASAIYYNWRNVKNIGLVKNLLHGIYPRKPEPKKSDNVPQ